MTVSKNLISKIRRAREYYSLYSKMLREVELELSKIAEKHGLHVIYHYDDELWSNSECVAKIPTNKGDLCVKEDGSVYLEEMVFDEKEPKIYTRVRRLE